MKLWIYLVILIIYSASAQAEVKTNKDWIWDLSGDEYAYAATFNEDGRVLGQYCYFDNETCYYLVNLGTNCEKDSEYPSILNSDAGVTEVKLICGHKYKSGNVFFIKPFDEVNDLIRKAKTVGFAIAMESGKFKVVRYSLSGSTYAIEMMRAGAEAIIDSKPEVETKIESEQYL
jgi:hypothetical protein